MVEHRAYGQGGFDCAARPSPDSGCADVDFIFLKSRVAVKFRKALIQPGRQPVGVGVKHAVGVLVIDDDVVFISEGIEADRANCLSQP